MNMSLTEQLGKLLLTTKDVESLWGISKSTLDKLRLTGDGPVFIKRGSSVFYLRESVERWLTSKQRRSTSDTGSMEV
jgi:predicted DNA-binding transcriptional regulator AlpA